MKSKTFEEVKERLEKRDAADSQYLMDIQDAEKVYHEAIRAAKKRYEISMEDFHDE